MKTPTSIWAIIPAAGIGSRMQSDLPKQYLTINNQTVIEHSIKQLLSVESVKGVVIAIRNDDSFWPNIQINNDKPVITALGGSERSDSVLSALNALSEQSGFDESCRVLVHDAVRPCVRASDITRLIDEVGDSDAGGLLAVPVRDTLKQQDVSSCVDKTIDRDSLWQAQTPQYFPWKQLADALTAANKADVQVTDESSAMEYAGFKPKLVTGSEDNIKITRPADLKLAEFLIQRNINGE